MCRENASSMGGAAFGEVYHANGAANGSDPLNQLPAFARGTLNGAKDTIATPSHSQSWSLDAQGNWSSVTTDGTAQNRTHNAQNEITSGSVAYDNDSNTTTDDTGKTFVYDAWNR